MPVNFPTHSPGAEIKYHWHGTFIYLPTKDKAEWLDCMARLRARHIEIRYSGSNKYPVEMAYWSRTVSSAQKAQIQRIVAKMKRIMERHHRRMLRQSRSYREKSYLQIEPAHAEYEVE